MYNPIDKSMIKLFNKYNINYLDSPLFLNKYNDLLNYKILKDKKKIIINLIFININELNIIY